MQHSLHRRIWFTASLTLLAFVIFIGLGVERAYRETLHTGLHQQLEARLYGLMAAVEFDADGLRIDLPDPALASPASFLCAWIDGPPGLRWRSASCLGKPLPQLPDPGAGQSQAEHRINSGHAVWVRWMGVDWEMEDGRLEHLLFAVMHDEAPVEEKLAAFHNTLLLGLALAGAVLLLMQWLSLRWLLRPVRELEREVHAVEQGRLQRVAGHYPRELDTLAQALNGLIHTGQVQLQRYRNALADLAHSLKTPLQVMRALLDEVESPALRQRMGESLQRMDTLVRWHLQRAGTAGERHLAGRVALEPLLQALVRAMNRLFGRKGIRVELNMPQRFHLHADEGDLQELMGNLVENACKWARSRVRVEACRAEDRVWLWVDDDGPGFPEDMETRLMERGVRADQRVEGQGIGLSVVLDIVRAYGGHIRLSRSPLGGARVEVELPQS